MMIKLAHTLILGVLTFTPFAFAEQLVTVPELEGGFTASIGTFYAVPSSGNQGARSLNAPSADLGQSNSFPSSNSNGNYGAQGSLGYNFDNTANGAELSYRGFNN